MRVVALNVFVAHQGGWDELIVLVAPVALFGIIRFLERRRRPAQDEDATATDTATAAPAPGDGPDSPPVKPV